MPKWNLRDDWPSALRPKDKNNKPIALFSLPINYKDNKKYGLSIKEEKKKKNNVEYKIKKLVIEFNTNESIDVLAMVPGNLSIVKPLTNHQAETPAQGPLWVDHTQQLDTRLNLSTMRLPRTRAAVSTL